MTGWADDQEFKIGSLNEKYEKIFNEIFERFNKLKNTYWKKKGTADIIRIAAYNTNELVYTRNRTINN